MGFGQPKRGETPQHRRERFQRQRLELANLSEQFLLSLALISRIKPIKTCRSHSSYTLKHIAENYECTYPDGTELGPRYVSNGAFIAAAIYAGFRFRTHDDWLGGISLNVTFNMSKTSIDDLDAEIRPNGAVANERERRQRLRRLKFRHTYPLL